MGGVCGTYGRHERFVQGLVGRPEGKSQLGRHQLRWKCNIKMYLQEVGWGVMDWTQAQDRDRWRALVNEVMNFQIP